MPQRSSWCSCNCDGPTKEFSTARDEIKRIIDAVGVKQNSPLGADEPRLFLVPGNHDLDWSEKEYEQKIERYGRLATDLESLGVVSAVYRNFRQIQFLTTGQIIHSILSA